MLQALSSDTKTPRTATKHAANTAQKACKKAQNPAKRHKPGKLLLGVAATCGNSLQLRQLAFGSLCEDFNDNRFALLAALSFQAKVSPYIVGQSVRGLDQSGGLQSTHGVP